MSQDIFQEILRIENEAENIINNAREKIRLLNEEADREIENITLELNRRHEDNVRTLEATMQKIQNDQALRLREEFEEKRNLLNQIDRKTIDDTINLVFEKICNL